MTNLPKIADRKAGVAPQCKYLLRSPFIGKEFEIPITPADFSSLSDARALLSDYLSFEETVLLVLYAWEEFELFLLNTSLHHHVFPIGEFDALHDTRLRANPRVLGVLNSITSLRDQFPKFRQLLPSADLHQHFDSLWQSHRQASTSFNFSERLRNYAQHQTQPVSTISIGGRWLKGEDLAENNVSVFVKVDLVCANRSIKAAEKAAYRAAYGEQCDIGLILREAMGSIGQITNGIRIVLKAHLDAAIAAYGQNLNLAKPQAAHVVQVVTICDEHVTDKFDIFPEFIDRITRLRRTRLHVNNEKHFTSSRARGHK